MTEEKKTEETMEIAVRQETHLVRPVVDVADLIASHREATDLIAKALVKGTDYGVIPGTGKKAVLLQPGGERLLKAFGCRCEYEIVSQEIDHDHAFTWEKKKKKWNNRTYNDKTFTWEVERGESLGLYRYVVRATVVQRVPGFPVVGSSIGEASTMESKYVDRPRECANTVLKMAQKRAMVSAVKEAFGLSDRFTVDLEDQQEDQPAPAPEVHIEPEPAAMTAAGLWTKAQAKGMTRDQWTSLCAVHGLEKKNTKDKDALARVAKAVEAYKAEDIPEGEIMGGSLPPGVENAPANADAWEKGRE